MRIFYSHFYWLFACISKQILLQVYLESCAYKTMGKWMADYVDANLFPTDED